MIFPFLSLEANAYLVEYADFADIADVLGKGSKKIMENSIWGPDPPIIFYNILK